MLEQDRIPSKQCGHGKPKKLPHRKIPRHDREDSAQGFMYDKTASKSCINTYI
jgi:hypothetical protein